eukprot:XP_027328144.1 follistatin-related protein 3 [Anas platyrhynchos]
MPLRLALCLLALCGPAGGDAAHGGICWLQQGKEAKCTMILKTGVTWEECCANGNVDVAWSNYTYPGNKISLLGFLGLVTCHPCKARVCEMALYNGQLQKWKLSSCEFQALQMFWRTPEARIPSSHLRGRVRTCSRTSASALCFPAESCSSVVCPGTHTCVVDQTGSAHCVTCRTAPCPEPTSLDHALCGNNNVTYPSACHLRRATCHLGRSIGVRHYGSCSAAAKFSLETDNAEENYV